MTGVTCTRRTWIKVVKYGGRKLDCCVATRACIAGGKMSYRLLGGGARFVAVLALIWREAGMIRLARRNPVAGIMAIFASICRWDMCRPFTHDRSIVVTTDACTVDRGMVHISRLE
jgi:hypothetical protein